MGCEATNFSLGEKMRFIIGASVPCLASAGHGGYLCCFLLTSHLPAPMFPSPAPPLFPCGAAIVVAAAAEFLPV